MVFYNYAGKPIAYCDDGEEIYLFSGKPVAYFYKDLIYGYNGNEFGWFENGWVMDMHGKCAFFTEKAKGGPVTPVCSVVPVKCVQRVTPVKAVRKVERVKPVSQYAWSNLSNEAFFMQ